MRTIDELGISRPPWFVRDNGMAGTFINAVSCDREENQIAVMDTYVNGRMSMQQEAANARLIAAAPELYSCLLEAVKEKCEECHEENDYESDIDIECGMCKNCQVKKWRDVLAKASGEEVK